jgi:O-acetylhomoserine/O-acetylserine sulfhydrylase-like pyridoxal-dependent enzyme
MSPFNAFQLIQGIETLSLRAKAHSENANALAKWLSTHPMVKEGSVMHPSLPFHPSHENAKKYFRDGCFGSVFCFEIKGDTPEQQRARGEAFIDNVEMFAHLANVGDCRTLVIHPASTTHQQLTPEEQAAAGVQPASVRVSVGYEDLEDIKLDFENAFKKAAVV